MRDLTEMQVIGDGATWMCSTQFGAPQMDGGASSNGQMLQVLDAILIDGFNPQVSTGAELLPDGFVKIKFGTAVGYKKRQKILITGANDANLNGEHIITDIMGNDITIKSPDTTVVTGTITAKVAPLGWESIFGSTDPLKRAYRSKNPNTTQTVIYLDMTLSSSHGYHSSSPAHRAMVSLCKDMTEIGVEIDSYTTVINDKEANINGSLFWRQKQYGSKAEAMNFKGYSPWTVVGNGDYFYFMVDWASRSGSTEKGGKDLFMFGDLPSFAGVSDEWCCAWAGVVSKNDVDPVYVAANGGVINGGDSKFFISNHLGAVNMWRFTMSFGGGSSPSQSGNENIITYPNPTTASLVTNSLIALSDGGIRAAMPRIMYIPHRMSSYISTYKDLDNTFIDDYLIVSMSGMTGVATFYENAYFAFYMGD